MSQVSITQLLQPIVERVRGCPTDTLISNYVRGARDFCNKSRWLIQTISGVTEADEGQYLLGDDPHHEIMGIEAVGLRTVGTQEYRPLTEDNATGWENDGSTDESGYYRYMPHASLQLHPTPNAVYDLSITLVLQPKRGVNSLEEALLVNWEDGFIAGALYHLLRIPFVPWTDMNESNNQYKLFQTEVNAAKADKAAGYNAGAATTSGKGRPNALPRSRILPI